MEPESTRQRASFQFELYKLNLTIVGAIMAFSIAHPEWKSALLTCPAISSILFIMWFHYGISIADGPRDNRETPQDLRTPIKRARRYSFAVAMLANFVLLPTAAAGLYFTCSLPKMFVGLGIVLFAISTVLFILWYRVQYHNLWLDGPAAANKPSETSHGGAPQRQVEVDPKMQKMLNKIDQIGKQLEELRQIVRKVQPE